MEYKDTIFLPKTSFEMRANLPAKEPKILEDWDKEQIRIIVRITDPDLPSYKQVTLVQDEINKLLQSNYQLVVQRAAVDVIGPKEVITTSEESEEAENNQTQQNDPVETPEPGNSPPLLESKDESEQPSLIDSVTSM